MRADIRVLFVINGLGTGGAERSLAELLPGLSRSGIAPTIVCLGARREGVEADVRLAGYDVRLLRSQQIAGRVAELARILSAQRPDILHTTIFESDVVGRIAATGRQVKVLTSLVNTQYDVARLGDSNVRRWKLAAVRIIDGWTARHMTDHFHALTNSVKAATIRALRIRPERITVVERGRDPDRLGVPSAARRAGVRASLGLSEDQDVLISVGRREYQKGQRYLLEAAAVLARERPRAVVLVAGREGNASRELDEIAQRLGLAGRVLFLGHREDVPDLLSAADAFVFPSLYEGASGALIEAMALGLPIVGSDIDAIREVVDSGANAILTPAADPRALGHALNSLLSDRDRMRRFGDRSREIFEERFTLERSTAGMVDLYRLLAA